MTERHNTGILNCKDPDSRSRQMAFFTVSGYGKSRFTLVAHTTRLSLLHLLHRIADASTAANKNRTVAFIALEHFQMFAVAKPGVKGLETDILNIFVAFLAITFG